MIERAISKRWLVFLATVAVHGLYTRGRALISSDTARYIALSNGFLSGDVSQTFTREPVRWTKTLYLLILALACVATPHHWQIVSLSYSLHLSRLLC